MARRPLRSLLERPVRLNGIELGVASDALVDLEALRVVGFHIACGDGRSRFLPIGAGRVVPGALEVASPLILLDEDDQAFYRKRGRSFAELAGSAVERGDVAVGQLVDVFIDADGSIASVQVSADGSSREVLADAELTLGGVCRESAA